MTYVVDNGPKVNWFCVSWIDCAIEQEKGEDEGGGGCKFGPHLINQSNYIFIILFIYPGHGILLPTPCRTLFAVSRCTDPKYTLPVTITNRTPPPHHHHHHSVLLRGVCSPHLPKPPNCEAFSCSTYTHSFPSPPSHLIPSDWPPGSGAYSVRLSCTLSSSCSLKSLLSIYESSFLSLYVSISINLSLPIIPFSPLSHASSPKKEKQKEGGGGGVSTQGEEPEPSPFEFYYKQTSTSQPQIKE